MSDIAPLMDSEDFKFLINEMGEENLSIPNVEDTIPEAYDVAPSNENFSGNYNFDVGIPHSKSLVYSPELEKLFIKMSNDFTVHFMWNYQHNEQLFVRAKPRFSSHEDANKPVKRCLQHAHRENLSNQDANAPIRHHILRCNNSQAIYEGGADQHFSVYVPLIAPEAGTEFVPHTYQFVCQNSCASGMNRRPIEVIFTLEDRFGDIHGRKSINVRICSCPKRDKEKEESEIGDSPAGQSPPGKKRKGTKRPHTQTNPNGEGDTSIHTITVTTVGLHNKTALLRAAFDKLAGDLLLHPNNEHIYKPHLEEIRNMLNNSQ